MLHRVSQVFKTCGVANFFVSRVVVSWTEDLFFFAWMNWGSPDGSPGFETYLHSQEVLCQEQIVQGHQEKIVFGSNHQTSFSGTSAASFKLGSWDMLVAHLGRREGVFETLSCKECGPLAANVGRLLFLVPVFCQRVERGGYLQVMMHSAPGSPARLQDRKSFIVASFSNSIIVQLSTAGTWGPGSHPRSLPRLPFQARLPLPAAVQECGRGFYKWWPRNLERLSQWWFQRLLLLFTLSPI